jgi:hypothetical protein
MVFSFFVMDHGQIGKAGAYIRAVSEHKVNAAKAAVSARKVRGPSCQGAKPAAKAKASSAWLKPPSGPLRMVT